MNQEPEVQECKHLTVDEIVKSGFAQRLGLCIMENFLRAWWSRASMVSAHPTRVVMVIGFLLAVFFAVGVASDGETSRKCERIAGKWDMTYSGTSCQGEPEKGHFVLVIEPDCSFELKKENTIPFLSTLFAPGGKVRLKGTRIEASVDMPFDACERITFNGTIHESDDGQRITGSYRYRSEGEGRFTGAKEDRNDVRGQLGGPKFYRAADNDHGVTCWDTDRVQLHYAVARCRGDPQICHDARIPTTNPMIH